ncbi:nuclear transcription factor Y subunit A-10-like isoform X2 [Tasmannia lanceolata]|uniref:nuclear transcription factor Y subunit A-10-like isoform X2 n=1 Tax=Tasmannia lanceolata TaxID=3420 RepID=UPI0040637122
MQAVCVKDHGGILQNPISQSAPVAFVPWWSVIGSQPVYGESFNHLKSVSVDQPSTEDHFSVIPRQVHHAIGQGPSMAITEKEGYDTAKFTIFPSHNKDSRNGQKSHELSTTIRLQSSPPEHQPPFDLGLGQPKVCAEYPYMDQSYSLFAFYGAQKAVHGRMLLPLNVMEDGPVYVNAKQYHGIIRRRECRAKAARENKVIKLRKPYLHESRHLHAKRRARGCGGRFLNTKNTGKSGSESDKEARAFSSRSGSEVTSMYSHGDTNHFQTEHLCPPFHPLSNVMDSGQSISFSSKWVPASDGCCDFFKV